MSLQYKDLLDKKYLHFPNLLSTKQIDKILEPTDPVEWKKQVSSRRNIKKIWNGAMKLTDKDIGFYSYVVLPDGRIDISLPKDLGEQLTGSPHSLLNIGFSEEFEIKSWDLLILPPNPTVQTWHQDNGGCNPDDEYTVFIPLNDAPGMGKTEIAVPYTHNFEDHKQTFSPNVKVGDALVFSGSLWHRGTANFSNQTRYCLYMILTKLPKHNVFEEWKN